MYCSWPELYFFVSFNAWRVVAFLCDASYVYGGAPTANPREYCCTLPWRRVLKIKKKEQAMASDVPGGSSSGSRGPTSSRQEFKTSVFAMWASQGPLLLLATLSLLCDHYSNSLAYCVWSSVVYDFTEKTPKQDLSFKGCSMVDQSIISILDRDMLLLPLGWVPLPLPLGVARLSSSTAYAPYPRKVMG